VRWAATVRSTPLLNGDIYTSELTRPHGSRFRDALAIVNPGACNPSGIAHSIVDACREIREHDL
jgi:hypothetical protein